MLYYDDSKEGGTPPKKILVSKQAPILCPARAFGLPH